MRKVLVVDDSLFMRLQIGKTVADLGFDIVDAADGEECLAAVEAHSPDLVLLDLNMPGLSGVEVLRELRRRYGELPVFIVTSDIHESLREQCSELGVGVFLNKPLEAMEISPHIRNLFGEKG